jgi:hypothetical protein
MSMSGGCREAHVQFRGPYSRAFYTFSAESYAAQLEQFDRGCKGSKIESSGQERPKNHVPLGTSDGVDKCHSNHSLPPSKCRRHANFGVFQPLPNLQAYGKL